MDYAFMGQHKYLLLVGGKADENSCKGCWCCSGALKEIDYEKIYEDVSNTK